MIMGVDDDNGVVGAVGCRIWGCRLLIGCYRGCGLLIGGYRGCVDYVGVGGCGCVQFRVGGCEFRVCEMMMNMMIKFGKYELCGIWQMFIINFVYIDMLG